LDWTFIVICILLESLKFWTHDHFIRQSKSWHLHFWIIRFHMFHFESAISTLAHSLGSMTCETHCVCFQCLEMKWVTCWINDLGMINKKIKKNKNWIFHWVTGPHALLSIGCSRQKVWNFYWLMIWLSLASSPFLLELVSPHRCFTPSPLKPLGLRVIGLKLDTWVNSKA